MAVAFEKPVLVVTLDEAPDDLVGLFQRFEIVKIQTLFFQRTNPTFHHTVALRLTDVGRGRSDPEPVQLTEKLMGRVLRSPVVTQTETQGDRSGVTRSVPLLDRPKFTQLPMREGLALYSRPREKETGEVGNGRIGTGSAVRWVFGEPVFAGLARALS